MARTEGPCVVGCSLHPSGQMPLWISRPPLVLTCAGVTPKQSAVLPMSPVWCRAIQSTFGRRQNPHSVRAPCCGSMRHNGQVNDCVSLSPRIKQRMHRAHKKNEGRDQIDVPTSDSRWNPSTSQTSHRAEEPSGREHRAWGPHSVVLMFK